jgi:transposase
MNKQVNSFEASVFCGIDVSARTLAVAVVGVRAGSAQREFANTASGHKRLLVWLGSFSALVRVSLEATGIYSLDLALALDADSGVELAVLNPKQVNRFAEALRRSKTDTADALVLAIYSQRMPFVRWQRPSAQHLQLRTLSRYTTTLVREQTALKNRLQTAASTATTPKAVLLDLKQALAATQRRLRKLRAQMQKMILADESLSCRYKQLTSVPGIADISGASILCELLMLAPEMGVRQWVASSGLDPVHQQSGTSVHKPSRISRAGNRYLRTALYMAALSAARYDQHCKNFYLALRERHKTGLQALMAVARKLLHAIYGIFKSNTCYDGQKLFPMMEIVKLSTAA